MRRAKGFPEIIILAMYRCPIEGCPVRNVTFIAPREEFPPACDECGHQTELVRKRRYRVTIPEGSR